MKVPSKYSSFPSHELHAAGGKASAAYILSKKRDLPRISSTEYHHMGRFHHRTREHVMTFLAYILRRNIARDIPVSNDVALLRCKITRVIDGTGR